MNCTKILTTCNKTWTYNKKFKQFDQSHSFSNLKHLSQNAQNSKTSYIEFQQVATKFTDTLQQNPF